MADETYSAKQVARRIGTDAKTFRKWLRSPTSPYPAVGQGQRYEFPVEELEHIKLHFDAWKNRGTKTKSIADFGLGKMNGHSKPAVTTKKLTKDEFAEELAARGKARDEEYGTIDGEYSDEEPTAHELWLIEQDTTDWAEDDPRWIDASPTGHGKVD